MSDNIVVLNQISNFEQITNFLDNGKLVYAHMPYGSDVSNALITGTSIDNEGNFQIHGHFIDSNTDVISVTWKNIIEYDGEIMMEGTSFMIGDTDVSDKLYYPYLLWLDDSFRKYIKTDKPNNIESPSVAPEQVVGYVGIYQSLTGRKLLDNEHVFPTKEDVEKYFNETLSASDLGLTNKVELLSVCKIVVCN